MYAQPHLYVTFGGTLGNGTGFDQWQTGFRVRVQDTFSSMPSSAQLGTLVNGPIKTFFQNAFTNISKYATVSWIKCAPVNENGDYAAEAVVYELTTPYAGGQASATVNPPQCALVVSLWSGGNLGEANHGRLYFPWYAGQVDGSGTTSGNGTVATNAATMFTNINTAAKSWGIGDTTAQICIFSAKGSGTIKAAVQTRVDAIVDTQRRRANRIQSSYASGTII